MAGGRPHTSGAVTVSGTSRAGMRSQIASRPVVQMGPGWASALNPHRPPKTPGADVAAVGLALASLVDDFNDNTVDTSRWPNSFGIYSETGGRARIQCDTGFNAYSSALTYRLAESSVSLRVYPPAAGGATTESWTQVLIKQQTNGTDIGFEISPLSGNLTMFSRVGFFDAGAVAITYDATSHAWLRIRETGGTTYWETSPEGSTWTARRTLASPSWVTDPNLEFQLIAHRSDGTTDYAEFDNVNIIPVTTASLTVAVETAGAQALSVRKTIQLGVAAETDTAQTVGKAKARLLGVAASTEATQSLAKAKQKALAAAAATEAAQPAGTAKRATLGTAAASDAAQVLTRTKTVHAAVSAETDTAPALTVAKTIHLGVATETDEAQSVRISGGVQLASETGLARPLIVTKQLALGTAIEAETTLPLVATKRPLLSVATETGAGLTLTVRKTTALGAAGETSTAVTITRRPLVEDVDITVGTPYSPWAAGQPASEAWAADAPEADWEVAAPW